MFLVQATATAANTRHRAGERRSLLVFVRQDEETASAPNWALCESVVKNAGWDQPEFKGAQPATPDTVKSIQKTPEPAIDRAYADAFAKGFGVLVFG
jgi:hypothetical protein